VRNAAILGVATLAALTLVGARPGLGLSLALLATYVAAAQGVRPLVSRGWWLLAVALAAVPLVRDAGWVVWPAALASLMVASLAAAGGAAWRSVGVGLVRIAGTTAGGLEVVRGAPRPGGVPAQRAAGFAAVLLAVFVPLFATADAAFAQLLDAMVPQDSVDHPLGRVTVWVAFVALGGALIRAGRAGPARGSRPARHRLTRIESTVPLALLTALFAAFVALQLTTLFGGSDYVLRTADLTYAEYARTGFAQLIVAAALTLAVIAAAVRWGRDERILLGSLSVLTLVILASAYKRLGLYEDAFGFTRLRLAADAAILWLAGLFVLVLAAGIAGRATWLPRAVVALTAGGILAFAISNPDGRIADRNIDRWERTGRIDIGALDGLSADAVPALTRLPPDLAACVTSGPGGDGLAGANLARSRARRALAGLAPGICPVRMT
jgi:hypothetical protein